MFIKQADLRNAAYQFGVTKEYYSSKSASLAGRTTAFLSHSHKDRDLAKGLQVYLKNRGWNVYIDWLDDSMPETISSETAARLKQSISENQFFLFMATANSCRESRWCPWEIGYADGVKSADRILIVPTTDDRGYEYGSEYLGLYKRIDEQRPQGGGPFDTAVMNPTNKGIWLKDFSI